MPLPICRTDLGLIHFTDYTAASSVSHLHSGFFFISHFIYFQFMVAYVWCQSSAFDDSSARFKDLYRIVDSYTAATR